MKILTSLPALVAGVIATGLFISPSVADEMPRTVVTYDDLNLATDKGVEQLYRRLGKAAASVCPAVTRDPTRNLQATACRKEVLDAAVGRINVERLTRVHSGRASRLAGRLEGL